MISFFSENPAVSPSDEVRKQKKDDEKDEHMAQQQAEIVWLKELRKL